MNNYKFRHVIISFYRFVEISEKKEKKKILDEALFKKEIKGTILLSDEGINGSLAGKENELIEIIKFLKKLIKVRNMELKVNDINSIPFNKLKVRLKKEIVSLGKGSIDVNKLTGEFIHPKKWDNVISNEDVRLIDLRNPYEIKIGKFQNSINPKTDNFREFPKKFKNMNLDKKDTIAMYCTGGIRCEKASAFLRKEGYKNILQLEGGILNYLNYFKNRKTKNSWTGECFVFDNRVAVKRNLEKGSYEQCYGCRSPITKKDRKSKFFIQGVSCPYCYKLRSNEQKKRSLSRQKQIDSNHLKF